MTWIRHQRSWRHAPPWKVAINAVLRVFQPQRRKLVVYTQCGPGDPPVVLGYGLGLIDHGGPR